MGRDFVGEEKWLGSKSNGNSFVSSNYLAGKLPNLLIDYLTFKLNTLKQG